MGVGALAEELVNVVLVGVALREILDPFVYLAEQRLVPRQPSLSRVHRAHRSVRPKRGCNPTTGQPPRRPQPVQTPTLAWAGGLRRGGWGCTGHGGRRPTPF